MKYHVVDAMAHMIKKFKELNRICECIGVSHSPGVCLHQHQIIRPN